ANSATVSDKFALPGVPSAPAAVDFYGGIIWIANPNVHQLERVEPPYTGIAHTLSVNLPVRGTQTGAASAYAGIAAGEGAVWVAGNESNHTLWRIDAATGKVSVVRLA